MRSSGMLGGYVGGIEEKIQPLKAEGVEVLGGMVDLGVYRFKF